MSFGKSFHTKKEATKFLKQELKKIRMITKDETIKANGFDMNNRPVFISTKEEDIEYTIDKNKNIWRHDGFTNKKM